MEHIPNPLSLGFVDCALQKQVFPATPSSRISPPSYQTLARGDFGRFLEQVLVSAEGHPRCRSIGTAYFLPLVTLFTVSSRSRKRPKQKKLQAPPLQRTIKYRLSQAVLGSATLIGGILAIWTMQPHLSLSAQSPLISTNAFTAPFQLSNDSWYSIYNVNAACSPKDIMDVDPANPTNLPVRILGPNIPDSKDNAEGFFKPKLEIG